MYVTKVRPIMEYADCVWLNLAQYQKDRLEAIQLEAARIITGAPRGTSHAKLYEETALETLEQRRTNHQLTLYYKMLNNIAPHYLNVRARVPQHQPHQYSLRNNDDPTLWRARTASYCDSFLPSVRRLWAALPVETKQAPTLATFKARLKKISKVPSQYLIGKRSTQIVHANMRMDSSNLSYDLYLRYLADDPSCRCGDPVESPEHFLRVCPLYVQLRQNIFGDIIPSTKTLLYGDENSDAETNIDLFVKVHNFIEQSNRFK